jgi:hypothetical protein
MHVLQVDIHGPHLGGANRLIPLSLEAQMRRFTFLLALLVVAGCNAEGPVDPRANAPVGISASVQTDTMPATEAPDSTSTTSSGGILIGSGT